MKTNLFLLAFILLAGCSIQDEISSGSLISRDGVIADGSTSYVFKGVRTDDTAKRLFADIYFKGDMLCFSSGDMTDVPVSVVTVLFVHPPSGHTLKAERLEKSDSRIWGFSLIGSLLEAFFPEDLSTKAERWTHGKGDIPVIIKMQWSEDEKTLSREKILSFRISY